MSYVIIANIISSLIQRKKVGIKKTHNIKKEKRKLGESFFNIVCFLEQESSKLFKSTY